jgi:mono/diheme cytochrome c family protein
MKRLKKILKWTGIIVLMLIVILAITIALRQNIRYDRPYPMVTASMDSTVINRGKRIVLGAGHCADCHSQVDADSMLNLGLEVPLSGGRKFSLPFGNIYTKNITPDLETGIGKYSDGEIARALRYGVHPDGTVVYDFMPFHNLSDEDLGAVISYLRVIKPIKNEVPQHSLNLLGMAVKAFLIKPVGPKGDVPKTVIKDTSVEYGRYLATSISNCGGCHTEKDMVTRELLGDEFAGGAEIEGYITPNLTPHPNGRMHGWEQKTFIERFRKGKLIPGSPMPWSSYRRMSDDELKAIYKFLLTLKPSEGKSVL